MPLTYFEALKAYNLGMSSWCVPRKGTPEYERVMGIRKRTTPEETEKRNVERRKKTEEQLKGLDTRAKIETKRETKKIEDEEAKELEKIREKQKLPVGPQQPTLEQINKWGKTTNRYGSPPFELPAPFGRTERYFFRATPNTDSPTYKVAWLYHADGKDGAYEVAHRVSAAELLRMVKKEDWWKDWWKNYRR